MGDTAVFSGSVKVQRTITFGKKKEVLGHARACRSGDDDMKEGRGRSLNVYL